MTARALRQPASSALGLVAGLFVLLLGSVVAGAGVLVIGPSFAMLPVALLALCAVVARPRQAALVLIAAGVAIDTAQIDPTSVLARSFWQMRPAVARAMPLTVSPFELLLALAALTVALRPSVRCGQPERLPGLAYAVPLVLIAGLAYGLSQGGPTNLAYHEARGLIFATVAFFLTWHLRLTQRELAATMVAATSALGLMVVFRYAAFLAGGGVPIEFWFGHETGLFLAFGLVFALLALLRSRSDGERVLLVLYALLMAAAMMMTGRRSAILVVLVGLIIVGWLLLPRRPVLLTSLGVVALLAGGAYLSAYWNAHTGPLAEPARAIRSQIDPDPRDQSSDEYRKLERENLQRNLAESPILGIGFGRPFTQFEPLPVLDFWPLQSYTPHQNLLWLWLKTGIAGASVLIGLWVVAFSRCVRACRVVPNWREVPVAPMLLAAALFMYLAYARVDMALVYSRSAVPLAVVVALALMLRTEPDSPNA